MALASRTALGPYTIVAALGAGGMGEVYRARDTRLGRDVAIKVLPPDVAADADRRARFEREARAVAALSHPNILAIFDIGRDNEQLYVVTELLDGETLADRLRGGALPVRKAIQIAIAIARGLAAAHGKGIAHRDLKPANVFLLADGQVKLLDFGLARATGPETEAAQASTQSALTDPGTVLGTVGYMAPEQVRGQQVDARADLFALGVVLYEMLAGQRAFVGESTVETLNAILKEEPPDLSATRADLPATLARIVRHCLEKNPAERFQTAQDVVFALETVSGADFTALGHARHSRPRPGRWVAVAAAVGGMVVGGLASRRVTPEPTATPAGRTTRALLALSDPVDLTTERPALALSPDGSRLVYAGLRDGRRRLFVRRLDDSTATPLAGTDGGANPIFSADGRVVTFVSDWRLLSVPVDGGVPTLVAGVTPMTRGIAHFGPNRILHNSDVNGALALVANGRIEFGWSQLARARGERSHRWPWVLPGQRKVLFTVGTATDFSSARLAVRGDDGREVTDVVDGASDGRYVSSGHLVFVRAGRLMAAPFDAETATVRGEAVPLVDDVVVTPDGAGQYSVADDGTLVYAAGTPWTARRTLVWVTRSGAESSVGAPPRSYAEPALSPDGSTIAVSIAEGSSSDVWTYHIGRGTLERFTSDAGEDGCPVWEPGGARLIWCSEMFGSAPQLVTGPVDRSAPPARLLQSGEATNDVPGTVAANGSLVFSQLAFVADRQQFDCCRLFLLAAPGAPPTPASGDRSMNHSPALSSDGRWLAYVSDETGRDEVYVSRIGTPGSRTMVSVDGGSEPLWARNGRELFFRSGDRMQVVAAPTGGAAAFGRPVVLFSHRYASRPRIRNYDATPDGSRFLMIRDEDVPPGTTLQIVVNWLDEVRRRVR